MKSTLRLLVASASLMSLLAHAQWQWLDKDGKRVFSDRPPTAEVPEKNILKRPGRAPAPAAPAAADEAKGDVTPSAAAAAQAAAGATPKLSGVDKDLAQRKKAAADADAAKRKAEEEKVEKARAENCARARQAKVTLDSGVRMSRTNAAGEREVFNDDIRASEGKRVQAIIDSDCGGPRG